MKKGYVYKITSPTGRIYIGSSVNIQKRFSYYMNNSSKNQVKLYRSIKKHGWNNHKTDIILVTNADYVQTAERLLGEYYSSLNKDNLNHRLPKVGDMICVSEETKRKQRVWALGRKASEGTKLN